VNASKDHPAKKQRREQPKNLKIKNSGVKVLRHENSNSKKNISIITVERLGSEPTNEGLRSNRNRGRSIDPVAQSAIVLQARRSPHNADLLRVLNSTPERDRPYSGNEGLEDAYIRRSYSHHKSNFGASDSDEIDGLRKISVSAAKPKNVNLIGSRRSVTFKPYTLREYKEKNTESDQVYSKLGGLGPNIGGERWQREYDKRQRIKEFSYKLNPTKV